MMRRAFTLMEILVSVMIFSIVSLALIGVLRTAVLLFRSGETGRAANDETLAALAQLDDDLKHLVPAADGGFLYAKVKQTHGHQAGNMALAFKIRNPDHGMISDRGIGARLIVVWWVDDDGYLNRNSAPAADSQPVQTPPLTEFDVAKQVYSGTAKRIASGCLYFGVDLSTDAVTRSDLEWSNHLPADTDAYSTESIPPASTIDPFPTAIRVTAVLTGGSRNVVSGRVVRAENGDDLRITGVGQIPVHQGAMARLGNPHDSEVEWLSYTSFSHGILACANGRAQRRTNRIATVAGLEITFAPSYSLVRTLPR